VSTGWSPFRRSAREATRSWAPRSWIFRAGVRDGSHVVHHATRAVRFQEDLVRLPGRSTVEHALIASCPLCDVRPVDIGGLSTPCTARRTAYIFVYDGHAVESASPARVRAVF